MHRALLLSVLLAPGVSSAQAFQVTLDERARALLGSRTPLVEARLEAELAKQTQALVGENDLAEFLDLAANAQALVHKSLGNDYGSAADGFILGASISAALDPSGDTLDVVSGETTESVPVSAGAQITVMAGYNFSALGAPELTLYAHGLGAPISISAFEGSFYNFGASAQYRLLAPRGTKWLGWGGLFVTSGIEVSRMRITVASPDMGEIDTTIGGVRIQGTSDGRLTLVQHAISVPLELTTSVTTLYVLTFYAGAGADLNFGGADLSLDVDATLTAGGESASGSAEAVLADAGDPDRVTFRLLGGVQTNFGPVHLFAQVNLLPADVTIAVAAGARVAF